MHRGTDVNPDRLSKRAELDLIVNARRGCAISARKLIDAHKDRLHAFVWRIIRSEHNAEDICQEAFLRAFANLKSFDERFRFSTWLFTIGYRLCLNSIRRKSAITGDMDFSLFADSSQHVDDQVAQSEDAQRLKKLIWDSVERLSVPQRAAVLLFYREGQSCSDIADVLQLPVATVKSHLYRARAKLKEMLEPAVGESWRGLRILAGAAG